MDDRGIDCVVRKDANTYFDVQIKARSRNVKYPGLFMNLDIPEPRANYFFVFYCEKAAKFWVVPSERITGSDGSEPLGKQIQSGKTKGTWRVEPWWNGKTEPGFEKYEGAWHYLGAKKGV